MSSCTLCRVYAFTLPWCVMPASSAHGPSCLRKRNACLRCLLSVPPCSSLLRVLLAASDLLRCACPLKVLLPQAHSQPSYVPVLVRNRRPTESSWTRTTCGACNGRPLLSFCILYIPVSTPLCTVGLCSVSIQDCTRSGFGSDDRAVRRKETCGQWHRPLGHCHHCCRPPSSLSDCPCPSILSFLPFILPFLE
jgi:hypothetical protein